MKKYFALLALCVMISAQAYVPKNTLFQLHNKTKNDIEAILISPNGFRSEEILKSGKKMPKRSRYQGSTQDLMAPGQYTLEIKMLPSATNKNIRTFKYIFYLEHEFGSDMTPKNVRLKFTNPVFKPKEFVLLPQVWPNNIKKADIISAEAEQAERLKFLQGHRYRN